MMLSVEERRDHNRSGTTHFRTGRVLVAGGAGRPSVRCRCASPVKAGSVPCFRRTDDSCRARQPRAHCSSGNALEQDDCLWPGGAWIPGLTSLIRARHYRSRGPLSTIARFGTRRAHVQNSGATYAAHVTAAERDISAMNQRESSRRFTCSGASASRQVCQRDRLSSRQPAPAPPSPPPGSYVHAPLHSRSSGLPVSRPAAHRPRHQATQHRPGDQQWDDQRSREQRVPVR